MKSKPKRIRSQRDQADIDHLAELEVDDWIEKIHLTEVPPITEGLGTDDSEGD